MRHRKRSRRLVGKWEHKRALMRNLLIALFVHERIRTTEAKAKELKRIADKMISLAKRGDLAARRQALSILPHKQVVRKIFAELRERYLDRESGFTRIVRIGPRRGDAAMMVFIELVTDKLEHKRSPKKMKKISEATSMVPPKAEKEPEADVGEETEAPEASSESEGEVVSESEVKGEEHPAAQEASTEETPEGTSEDTEVSEESASPGEEAQGKENQQDAPPKSES